MHNGEKRTNLLTVIQLILKYSSRMLLKFKKGDKIMNKKSNQKNIVNKNFVEIAIKNAEQASREPNTKLVYAQ